MTDNEFFAPRVKLPKCTRTWYRNVGIMAYQYGNEPQFWQVDGLEGEFASLAEAKMAIDAAHMEVA